MTETEAIEFARAYVALSNAHRVDLIRPLFARQATYRSSAVGEYEGVEAIAQMMQSFFDSFPDVHWECTRFGYAKNRVEFEFSLKAKSAQSGETIRRSGRESIVYDSDGLIIRLDVEAD